MKDFRSVADAVAEEIASGRLGPGERLPPQREFARRHAIANSTAVRVYQELARRGLTVGQVGRGTFVAAAPGAPAPVPALSEPAPHRVDLELNHPVVPEQAGLLAAGLEKLVRSGDLESGAPPGRARRDARRPRGSRRSPRTGRWTARSGTGPVHRKRPAGRLRRRRRTDPAGSPAGRRGVHLSGAQVHRRPARRHARTLGHGRGRADPGGGGGRAPRRTAARRLRTAGPPQPAVADHARAAARPPGRCAADLGDPRDRGRRLGFPPGRPAVPRRAGPRTHRPRRQPLQAALPGPVPRVRRGPRRAGGPGHGGRALRRVDAHAVSPGGDGAVAGGRGRRRSRTGQAARGRGASGDRAMPPRRLPYPQRPVLVPPLVGAARPLALRHLRGRRRAARHRCDPGRRVRRRPSPRPARDPPRARVPHQGGALPDPRDPRRSRPVRPGRPGRGL
ncbi:LOW QUALITY PROTEIN: transcriptional regulator, partial [Streptomyces filamentosus NRRL 15998]